MSPPARHRSLDALRGVAVMGILLLNVIDFAMPGGAYANPAWYGGAAGANWWAWALPYVLADGKFRGLFTLLFGAGIVLIAERAAARGEQPARVHYARMATLLLFGLAHAYLIWAGDILVLYAVAGGIAFVAWRWPWPRLVTTALVLLALKLAVGLTTYADARAVEHRIETGTAIRDEQGRWAAYRAARPDPGGIPAEIAAHRGGPAAAFAQRRQDAWLAETAGHPAAFLDTMALMLLGMALFRTGFLTGAWPRRRYVQVAIGGCVLLTGYAPLAWWLDRTGFADLTATATEAIHLTLLRPGVMLGYAAIVILWAARGGWLADRVAAAGRMAFSNYLGTSLLMVALFDGLGWYGRLERWQCYLVVPVVWALILAWSGPWLRRFRHGPFEWAWRSLACGRPQHIRRGDANASQ